MEGRRELVAAALFVLSRIRKTKDPDGGGVDLAEMQRALDILTGLSDPEEREKLSMVRGELDSLERERRDFMRDYDARLEEQNTILEEEVSALLLRHVPENQRNEIKGRLEEAMAGEGESMEEPLEFPGRQAGASRLERKLRMVEDNVKSDGLEKFLGADEGEARD
jgi:hypothetical protein